MSKKIFVSIIVLLVLIIAIFIVVVRNQKPPVELGQVYVRIYNIEPGQVVKSPLEISGEAKGNWYFEASFPIRIYDNSGTLLGTAVAQAQSDWMVEDFVSFKTTLNFTTPTTTVGEIIFKKDNPSGLPENDAEFKIPVKF